MSLHSLPPLLADAAGIPTTKLEPGELLAWVEGVEAACRAELGWQVASTRWLIGLNGYENLAAHRERWTATVASADGPMARALAGYLSRVSAQPSGV